jgi:hypothetical protein
MRKLLTLLVLAPLAVVLAFGCDDQPTAPEGARVATTADESTTPQASKAPTLPTPVRLSGVVFSRAQGSVGAHSTTGQIALCPSGKGPIAGGYFTAESGEPELHVTDNGPIAYSADNLGWTTEFYNSGDTAHTYIVYAVCVDIAPEDPFVIDT